MFRTILIAATAAAIALPGFASAQTLGMPSATTILRQLEASPRLRVAPQDRVTIEQLKHRPELRRSAPSIDIQSINFAFGSADIPLSQYHKVEAIAEAMQEMLRDRPASTFLVEGHTDAVGSDYSNLALSESRAASLRSLLVHEFGVPFRALETVGYGEEYLLVSTPHESWQNRRVTLRRVDDFLR